MSEQLSDLELEILELLSMNGETTELLVEMLNYEDEETPPLERKVTRPEIMPILEGLRARGLATSEPGYSPDPNTDKLELVPWWDVTAEGLAIVEALENLDDRDPSLPTIKTQRLLLRQWREEDLDPYARMCADPEVMRFMGNSGAPLTPEQTAKRVEGIQQHWRDHHFGLWAVEHKGSGGFIGRIGLQYHEDWPGEHKVEIGWLLDRQFWGIGLATEGAQASISYGFDSRKLERVISIALPDNVASHRVMEKCGLTLRGEARWRGLDVVWYAIDRNEWKADR